MPQPHFIIILSIVVGTVAGTVTALLKLFVHEVQGVLTRISGIFEFPYFFLAFPLIGMLLTVLFIIYLNRNKLGHGIGNILYTISHKNGHFERDKLYSQWATSALTVGFGGSAGLEGPIVHTGAAYGSNIARWMHLDYRRRLLMIGCGVAGGLSAVFAAPIAAVIFVFEVLMIEVGAAYFVPLLLASVSGMIMGTVLNSAETIVIYDGQYTFHLPEVPLFLLLGVITGLVSVLFHRIYRAIDRRMERFKKRLPKALLGGLILGGLIFLFPALYGEGFDVIRMLLQDRPEDLMQFSLLEGLGTGEFVVLAVLLAIVLFKMVATSVTITSGGNGGIFAPTLFLGAMTGYLFARALGLLHWPYPFLESAFALVAMAGVLSGVMRAPLTGVFLIAEVTSGYGLILPLMIVSPIAYFTARLIEPHSLNTYKLAEQGVDLTPDKDRMVLRQMKVDRVIERDLPLVSPDATLGHLVEQVKHSTRNVFPVVDDQRHLHGIVSLDQIREVMFQPEKYDTVKVRELMRLPPGHVDINDSMDEVMRQFTATGAWNLPVLDNGRYVGMLSKSRIFSAYRNMLIHQTRD